MSFVKVERLIFEMTTQTVALSGKKFYFLTRRLLFGVNIIEIYISLFISKLILMLTNCEPIGKYLITKWIVQNFKGTQINIVNQNFYIEIRN